MDRLAESKVREIVGEGKLFQVATGGDEFSYEIEREKGFIELISSWNSYCSNTIIGEVSKYAEASEIISGLKKIFGEDCTILAYERGASSYVCHKDEVILWQSGPFENGCPSVSTDKTVTYLVCKKNKKRLNLSGYTVEKEETRLYLYRCA